MCIRDRFRTVQSETVSRDPLIISVETVDHQINRKTLAYAQQGEVKYSSEDSLSIAWRYDGTCKKVAANMQGNKV